MKCRDCDKEHVPSFTMDFTDVGGTPLYFCEEHGKIARELYVWVMYQIRTRPGFQQKLEALLDRAELANAPGGEA